MLVVVFILLGIGAEIVKANAWFIIPNYVSWICFGVAGVACLLKLVNYFTVRKQINKMNKKFRAW